MPRIAGVDIPEQKKVKISLTYIFGIGKENVKSILSQANVDGEIRARELNNEEVARLQRAIEKINTEGNLKKQIRENIQRLIRIGSYRGSRHTAGLPARGQRTRTNARTKRGRRNTIGAVAKDK